MKKIVSLIISSCLLLGLVFFAYPSCDVNAAPSLSDYWEEYYDYIADGYSSGNFLNGIGRQLVAGIVTPIRYYTDPDFGSGTKTDPYEVTSSPVTNPQPIIKYDSVNNDLRTYNYETNNYETITNIYRSTNVNYTEGYEYVITTENNNYYYNFENTYYSLNQSVSTPDYGEYYQVYYELPDGRSSYNLTAQDVYGLVFNYDTILYDYLPLDSTVVGLFHLDGNTSNSLDASLPVYSGSHPKSVEGHFDGGYSFELRETVSNTSYTYVYFNDLYLPLSGYTGGSYTVDFWLYQPLSNTTLYTVDYKGNNVSLTYRSIMGFSNGWRSIRLQFDSDNHLAAAWVNGIPYNGTDSFYSVIENINGIYYLKFDVPRIIIDSVKTSISWGRMGCIVDEVLVRNGYYGTVGSSYDYLQQPNDLPYVFTRPTGRTSTLALKSTISPNTVQYGGVRNIAPSLGDVFLNIEENRITSIQQFFNGIWNEIDAAFYSGDLWIDAKRFDVSSLMILPDNINSTVSLLDRILSKLDEIKNSLGSGGGSTVIIDPSDSKDDIFPLDPDIEAPVDSGFSPLDFLLILLYIVMALVIVLKVFNLFLGFVGYLFTLISIPASTLLFETSEKFSYLDENGLSRNYIQDVFGVLKGEVHFGLEEPLYAINIGSVQITFFTFMVMLFQMVIIGAILYYVHQKTASFDVPKWRD